MGFTRKKMINVGVSVTIDGRMEVVVVNPDTKTVMDYKTVPMEYNFQTKEISEYAVFGATLRSILFDEMNLNSKNIKLVLTVPSIHFATAQLPAAQAAETGAIGTMLSSYAQDSYLFKRHEPTVAYQTYTNSNKDIVPVIYSALQENVVTQLKDVLVNDVGVENFSINNPYASIINALDYCGLIEKQVSSNTTWNFVQITNNGFILFSMVGTRILEINDMPLPLKTFAPEEIYESMALSLQNNLSIYPASQLFVLSRTDLLSAQILLQSMELRGDIAFLENNRFNTEPFININENVDPDLAKIISVEVIGSAITTNTSPMNLCYMTNKDSEEETYGFVNLLGQDVAVNNTFITRVLFGLSLIFALIGTALFLIFGAYNSYLESNINKYESEKADIERQIAKANGESEGNVENIIAQITKNNQAMLSYFSVISTDIPSNMWLTLFSSNDAGALGIEGDTSDVASVYSFFKGVKGAVPESNVSLSELAYNDIDALLSPDAQGNKTMHFKISNNEYDNTRSMMTSQVPEIGDPSNNNGGDNNSNANRPAANNNAASNNNNSDDVGLPAIPESVPPTN